MKKITYVKRIFTIAIVAVLLTCCLPASVFAAKENFTTCSHIGIRNCDAPVAGQKPDFDVTPYSPGQYSIMSVNWYKGANPSTQNIMGSTMSFEGNTVYTVEFEVWAKDAYTFTTDSNGYTTVTADVGSGAGAGEYSAAVWNVYGQDNKKYLTVRCTFPATGSTATIINEVSITDIVEPCAGDAPSYASNVSPYGALVQNIYWFDENTQMTGNAKFVEGKTYTVQLILIHEQGYEFAVDPNHILASAGKPFTAVTATINGKTATVMPDYTRGTAYSHIAVAVQFVCKPSRQITHVDITSVTEPKTGEEPKYFISCGDTSYDRIGLSNVFYAYGVAWLDGKGNYIRRNQDRFLPSTAYTISVTLKPTGNYIFAADEYDRPLVTATVNGNQAEVHKSSIEAGCIEVTYKFRKTESLVVSNVEVSDIDVPKEGEFPDYTMTLGDTTYAPFNSSDETTRNGIMWFDRTTNKYMKVGVDKFIGGHKYALFIALETTGDYTFKYVSSSDSYTVTAKINGKTASVDACSEDMAEISVDFTCEKQVHVCSPKKIDAVKATCATEGKESYYFCHECGKNFEDAKCAKEIPDINAWGKIEKLEHTGGKATCSSRAICKNCGQSYGELAGHSYSTAWDYKDTLGHAHKCKVCGAPDTIVPHSGGEGKCGEPSKCADCKAEYGEVIQHQWSKTPEYTESKGHAYKCTVCGEHDTVQAHTGGTADCQNKAVCTVCGTAYGKIGEHKWSTEWLYRKASGHAHGCTVMGCDEHDTIVKHTPGAKATETSDQLCTVCGYIIKPKLSHKHDLSRIDEVKATCTANGKKAYYYCESCDSIFSDRNGNNEITDDSEIIIAATGHKESKWKTDEDTHWKECTVKGCDEIVSEKEAHDFNKSGKCTVCSYRQDGKNDSEEVTDTTNDTADDSTDDTADDTADKSNSTPGDDQGEDDGPAPSGNNTAMWIAVIALGVVAAACIIVVAVVLAKKNRKN